MVDPFQNRHERLVQRLEMDHGRSDDLYTWNDIAHGVVGSVVVVVIVVVFLE